MAVGKGSLQRLNEAAKEENKVQNETEKKMVTERKGKQLSIEDALKNTLSKDISLNKQETDSEKEQSGSIISRITCELPFYLL